MENSLVGSSSLPSYSSYENYLGIGVECWLIAEKTARKVLSVVQPNVTSDEKRFEIINYIRKLIRGLVGDEVMVYGSMPFKTYLPHGDIDLTIISPHNDVKYLATSISGILQRQKSDDPRMMDVEVVDAKVQIVRCLVQHVPVDISFNQMAGLNSLCFLEQVDQYIGRDHLFKRSIILIKAWCFYESRLLGSRYGLLSTYALEILILYIINLFHSSLDGPLAVLYKFLDYYSTFDWDRYCISLNGPVDLNFLPKVVVETSATRGNNLLLSENFLKSCIRSLSVPVNEYHTETPGFQRKYLNIIDPLKLKNNLGFSISEAGSYRIKLAFSYGCRKLRHILQRPVESIVGGVMKFFTNICESSAWGQMLDGEVVAPECGSRVCQLSNLKGDYDCPIEFLNYAQWYINSNSDIFQLSSLVLNPWLIQSQSIMNQIPHGFYYLVGGDGFASSLYPSLCHPDTYPHFSSVLTVDETAACLGQSRYRPSVSSKGKSKLCASAPPFMSSAVGKKVKCKGTGLFVPKVDEKRKPKSKETEAQCSAHQMNVSEMVTKCKGLSVGTPMENQLINAPSELYGVGGSSCFDPSREKLNLPPPCEKPAESNKHGESSCFDLSLEHFPLLPSRKKAIESGKPIDVQLTKDSGEKSTETNWDGKSSCFDLSLEDFPPLPCCKKVIQSGKRKDSAN